MFYGETFQDKCRDSELKAKSTLSHTYNIVVLLIAAAFAVYYIATVEHAFEHLSGMLQRFGN